MQKVITINLNGNAYQLDERGYAALLAYLETAERQLADNPDRAPTPAAARRPPAPRRAGCT